VAREIDDEVVRGIDDDDVDDPVEELVRIAWRARWISRTETDPTPAAVRRLEQPGRRLCRLPRELRAVAVAGPHVNDAGIHRIDRNPARLAYTERGRPVEDRRPGRAAVPRQPHAAPSRADVDDVGIVRVDRDRGDLAVGADRALVDRARPDRRPDRSLQAHSG